MIWSVFGQMEKKYPRTNCKKRGNCEGTEQLRKEKKKGLHRPDGTPSYISSSKVIFMDCCMVTAKVLNSYGKY